MTDSKFLSEGAWKVLALKNKIKDNGLQKALADYQKLEDEDYDSLLECIASVKECAVALKKNKEVSARPEIVKYLAGVVSAAEAEQRDLVKAKDAAEKANAALVKAEAMIRKKAETEAGEDDETEEEEEESGY